MKSYFSSLARQTGMRPAAQKANVRKSSEQDLSTHTHAPLHREETVMIAPTENAQHELKDDVYEQPTQSFKSEKRKPSQNSFVEKEFAETFFPTQHIPLQVDEKTNAGLPHNEKASAVYPVIHNEEFAETEKTILPIAQVDSVKNQTKAFEEKDVIPFSVQETKPTVNQAVVKEPVVIETQTYNAPLEEQQKDYFKLTNKLLESGRATKKEIHQTLFSEVQEWVAASPIIEMEEKLFVTNDERVNSIVKPLIEHERVVLQEPVSVRDEPSHAIEQQEFNLSIGNISIVIEEPPQSVINQTQVQNKTEKVSPEESQEFSRLSRYYI